jgi:predicted RNA-binding protein
VLVLVPQTRDKPFHRSDEFKDARRTINRLGKERAASVHVCFYAAPFGVVPLELDEVYPLSQHEIAMPLDCEVVNYVAKQVDNYIDSSKYGTVVLLHDPETWGNTVKQQCRTACKRKGTAFELLTVHAQGTKEFLMLLESALKKSLGDSP